MKKNPIVSKPRTAKAGSEDIIAWGDPTKIGKRIRFEMTLDAPPNFKPNHYWQQYRITPISYRKKK